jgi:mRNA export factor
MDIGAHLLVIAAGGYKICMVDLRNPTALQGQPIDTPLKFQTRCVAVTSDAAGYTVGGIEGRVAVQ